MYDSITVKYRSLLGPGNYFVPTEMEKIKLVVGGAYRSLSEVPDVVR